MNLNLLKAIVSIGERFQKINYLDFSTVKIKVNVLLRNSTSIMYVLDVLEIPYERTNEDREKELEFEGEYFDEFGDEIDESEIEHSIRPKELNFSVGSKVDLKILYYLSVISKEIFQSYNKNGLSIYINYASQPEDKATTILFGSFIRSNQSWTNISRAINPNEIAELNIETFSWENFSQLFPNVNPTYDGKCTYTEECDSFNPEDELEDNRDYYDSDRENFNALTDGQYGEYDDWRENGGDFGSLRDSLGL